MLSLPDTLVLFALHDDKGTVHPAAFLALDHALRGSALAELRLLGCLKTWRDGRLELGELRSDDPLLVDVHGELARALPEQASVLDALALLSTALPELRTRVISRLERAGILTSSREDRTLLPSTHTHPMTDGTLELQALRDVRSALGDEGQIQPRLGTLVALIDSCGLIDILFEADDRDRARSLALLVRQRDAIAEAVQEASERTSGVWE